MVTVVNSHGFMKQFEIDRDGHGQKMSDRLVPIRSDDQHKWCRPKFEKLTVAVNHCSIIQLNNSQTQPLLALGRRLKMLPQTLKILFILILFLNFVYRD